MGVETRILSSDREKAHSCLREVPLGSLMSSLHSAKDFIVPVFSSCVGRVLVRHHSNTAPSSIVLASVGFSQDFLAHQGSSDDCRTVLAKESSSCQSLPPANSGTSDARLSSGFLGICTDEDISGVKNCLNGFPDQRSRFSGLSLQGLPSFPPGVYLIFKQRCFSDKAHESVCFDDCASERPSMGADLFQTMMDHCLFAASILSKQAGQVAPLNEKFFCAINDSKEKVMEFLHGNLWVNSSVQKNQRVSDVLQRSGIIRKAGQANSVRPVCLGFASIGGDFKDVVPSVPNAERPASTSQNGQSSSEHEASSPIGTPGLFKVPMPTIERLRSTLSTVSLAELVEFLPQLGKTSQDFPDKKKLFSVQDFFQYTEAEGRRFFEELDRDNDGQVTLEDLEAAMRKRRLPQQYARDFLRRTRKNLFMKSFGWHEFLCLMEQKEAMMLRAYNSLNLSKSGTLQKSQVLTSLHSAGLPATEENVAAMLRCLDPDAKGSIAYGQFRNFMLLLPPERLGDDPRMVWFEAATVVPMAPPVTVPAENVLKSALAGGLACALSTSLMHPIDTIKTRVQASSTLSFPELLSKLPEIGVKGLYRGSIPAILGQFSSHGLRTGIFEASKLLLTSFAPGLAELQVQSMASFCSTVLGTAVRIPCEVLKQRLQAGIFSNVGEAIIGTWQRDGPRGFFRGTGATLCREVPFYVAGMCIYAEAKKTMRRLLNRELEPWETIAVGAVSGGLAAVFTTPFDVMKTRTMTAAPGLSTNMSTIALTILREEGALGLFKGAVPRFFWIAPLGAMNFAGYELAKRAMEKQEQD